MNFALVIILVFSLILAIVIVSKGIQLYKKLIRNASGLYRKKNIGIAIFAVFVVIVIIFGVLIG